MKDIEGKTPLDLARIEIKKLKPEDTTKISDYKEIISMLENYSGTGTKRKAENATHKAICQIDTKEKIEKKTQKPEVQSDRKEKAEEPYYKSGTPSDTLIKGR